MRYKIGPLVYFRFDCTRAFGEGIRIGDVGQPNILLPLGTESMFIVCLLFFRSTMPVLMLTEIWSKNN